MGVSYEQACGEFISEWGEQVAHALEMMSRDCATAAVGASTKIAAETLGNASVTWAQMRVACDRLVEWTEEESPLFTTCLVCGSSTPHHPHAAALEAKIIGQHVEGDHSDCAVEACSYAAALARTQALEADDGGTYV